MNLLACSVLFSILFHAAFFLLFWKLRQRKIMEYGFKEYILHGVISLVICFVLIYSTGSIIRLVSSDRYHLVQDYWPVFLTEAVLCCTAALCEFMLSHSPDRKNRSGWYQTVKTICLSVFLFLFCEIFVFNSLSFVPILKNMPSEKLTLTDGVLDGSASFCKDGILIGNDSSTVTFENTDWSTCCFRIQASENHKLCNVSVEIEDDNLSKQYYYVGSYGFCMDSPRTTVLPVYSTGKLKGIRFRFNGSADGLVIRGITVNRPDFFFCLPRFLCLSAAAALLILILRKKIWKMEYRRDSAVQNITIASLALLLCILSSSLGKTPIENKDIVYPLENSPDAYGCYVQQFDAFQKGQLNLDLTVDPKLVIMDNPYDTSARNADEVSSHWDRSYYKGKYYSYFGIVPLYVVYYPYYWAKHALPCDLKAASILALFAVPVLILLVRELICYFCKKINFLLLLLGMAATVFSSLLYTLQISADFYYIAYLSEMLFVCLFLLLAYRAAQISGHGRTALLFVCGAAYVLAVGSRPVAALSIVLAVPAFLQMFRDKTEAFRTGLAELSCFAVPVLLGAALLMKFNYDRFGSPFEFGTSYQLTIDNMRYNRFSLLNIIPAVYHYFLQLPLVTPTFPFFHVTDSEFNYYASYKLHIVMLGMLSFPSLWWLFGMRRAPVYRERKDAKLFCLSTVVLSVFIALLNYSVSGMNIRYVTDFSVPLSILSILVIISSDTIFTRYAIQPEGLVRFRALFYVPACVSLLATVAVGAAAIFSNERNYIYYYDPGFYANLERLFMFW